MCISFSGCGIESLTLRLVFGEDPRFEAAIIAAREQEIFVLFELDLVDFVKRVWISYKCVQAKSKNEKKNKLMS